MKLNITKRIVKEDFEEKYQALVEKLAFPLNQFIDQISNALNKQLTIEDNLPFEIKTFNVTVDSDGIPIDVISFKVALKPRGMKVINATNVQDTTALTGAPFVQWTLNNSIVTILMITGLPANKKFSLTIETTS